MPPRRRRAGAREGALSPTFKKALDAEVKRLDALPDDVETVKVVGDFFAQIDRELEAVASVRLKAVKQLRKAGLTYSQIAEATGLSEPRVAQLSRAANVGGRASSSKSPKKRSG